MHTLNNALYLNLKDTKIENNMKSFKLEKSNFGKANVNNLKK